jgi:hypothetical protein
MREISEIKAAMIGLNEAYYNGEQTPERWEKHCEAMDLLRLELFEATTKGIMFDRLEAICAAEREGRCVVLPVPIGTMVYRVNRDCIGRPYMVEPCNMTLEFFAAHKDKIGKTVFLSRAQAEAAKGVG